jgi:hypothetical protein
MEVVNFTPRPLYLQEITSSIHWIGGWVGHRSGMDDVERKKFCPYRGSNSDPSAVKSRVADPLICAMIHKN